MTFNKTLARVGTTLLGIAALWYLVCETVAAIGFPGYNYATNWISDLGVPEPGVFQGREINSLLANVMNAGFVGHGLLFAIGALLIFWALPLGRSRTLFLALGLIEGLGITLVGMVHGSQANQDAGLTGFHFGGAALAIIGGNLAIIVARSALRDELPLWIQRACTWLGVLGLVSLALLFVAANGGWTLAPVFERGAVYPFLAASILIAGNAISRRRAEERLLNA